MLRLLRKFCFVIFCSIFIALDSSANCKSGTDKNPEKRGLWWCEVEPKAETEPEPEPEPKQKQPTLPAAPSAPLVFSHQEMMKMHPDQLEPLLQQHRRWAIYTMEPADVHNYHLVQDAIRRKAVSFAALTGVNMLKHPEMSSESVRPVHNAGLAVTNKLKREEIHQVLAKYKNDYALGLFVKSGCSYCESALVVMEKFSTRTGWRVEIMDILNRPDLAEKYNITTVPMLLLIQKGNKKGFPVMVGLHPVSTIYDKVYSGVRLMSGEITERQYYMFDKDRDTFFDPEYSP